jgi:hypothetical protein
LSGRRRVVGQVLAAARASSRASFARCAQRPISITLDRYGHLMPGSEDEAAGPLDAYLERAKPAGPIASVTA